MANAPMGTIAPSWSGGGWCRVESGWQWNGHLRVGAGSIFPNPGGDWDGTLVYPETVDNSGEQAD